MPPLVTVMRETRMDPDFPLSRQEFAALADIVLDAMDLERRPFEVKLVDDAEISRLNAEYMGCPGPTNVLSFPADEEGSMGQLAISVDAVARETALYGQEPVAHLARLLAHGILHLAGYDHGPDMYDLTDRAVERVLLEYGGI